MCTYNAVLDKESSYFPHRATEPYSKNVNEKNDEINERFQQEMVESEMGLCATVRAL
jgi:hypothetical protein